MADTIFSDFLMFCRRPFFVGSPGPGQWNLHPPRSRIENFPLALINSFNKLIRVTYGVR